MDNLTHALAGLALAEAALQWRAARAGREASAGFARLAYLTSAVANNVPDADAVYTWITGGPLGYLLHHRGHTHTAPVALTLGALTAAAGLARARRRGSLDPGGAPLVWGLGLLGPVAHVGMDAWNSYGVHPFWPLYDGWFYGDSVFIVEPLLWAALAPPLLFAARARWWRGALWALVAASVALPWALYRLVPLPPRLALALAFALSLAFARRASPRRRAAAAVLSAAAVALGFAAAGRAARAGLARRLASEPEPAALHDVALTPQPANPLCWTAIAVQTTAAGELVLRRATLAPLPALFAARSCVPTVAAGTAPLGPPRAPDDAGVRWGGEFRAPLARLRALARDHCEAAALVRFLRAPFWAERAGATVLGDLRFDGDEGLGFAEMALAPAPARCPAFVPPWRPPRADLLGAGD
jgi:inner membrane protein